MNQLEKSSQDTRLRILVAGIGGASLGTEVVKSLALAGGYLIFGCDIAKLAYGHYMSGVEKTFLVRAEAYAEDVLDICRKHRIQAVVAGGEGPMRLLQAIEESLRDLGVVLAGNRSSVVTLCSNKGNLFRELRKHSIPVPNTISVADCGQINLLEALSMPCVVKPATGSGGSAFTLLVSSIDEARQQCQRILDNGHQALVQEYFSDNEGEFTVGVLSLPECGYTESIALRREFHAKLSVNSKSEIGIISSGYSQGLIADFPEVRRQSERIAAILQSDGPLNFQGRVRGGVFYPFEINPRFSATTFLRALAGFNEIDAYLRFRLLGAIPSKSMIREGFYLRSLTESYIAQEPLIK